MTHKFNSKDRQMIKTMTINLKWERLTRRNQISCLKDGLSGVYIWGFYNDPFVPYMVGKATASSTGNDIKSRLWSHVTHLMSGEYVIHKRESLKSFYDYKDRNRWDELAYVPKKQDSIEDFIKERCGNLNKHIIEMVNNYYFTYAEADRNYVTDLEKSIIKIIGIDNLWNIRGGEPKKYFGRQEDLNGVIDFR